jgi:hypothetical protein
MHDTLAGIKEELDMALLGGDPISNSIREKGTNLGIKVNIFQGTGSGEFLSFLGISGI